MKEFSGIRGTSSTEFSREYKHPIRGRKKGSKRKYVKYEPVKYYKAIIPKNLDFDTLIREHNLEVTIPYKEEFQLIDRLVGLVDMVLRKSYESYDILSLSDEVFISSKTLKKYYDDYGTLWKFLFDSDVLEVNSEAKIDSKAKGIRFSEKYRNSGLKAYLIKFDKVIEKLEDLSVCLESIERYPHLYNDLQGLEIDSSEAFKMARRVVSEDPDKGRGTLDQYVYSFDRVNSDIPFFKVDKMAGRLHTPITNLKREFRQFLRYDGQELEEVDIKSSQPFFLACLLGERIWDNYPIFDIILGNNPQLKEEDIHRALVTLREKAVFPASNRLYYAGAGQIEPPPLYPKSYFTPNSYFKVKDGWSNSYALSFNLAMHRDFFLFDGDFNEMLGRGLLYEFNSWIFNLNTRDEGKDQMWKILYSPSDNNKRIRATYKKYFPNVIEFAEIINTGYEKTKKSGRTHEDQSCTLAILLQSLEARFILDSLVPYLRDHFPDIPIFTIHDSILVPKGLGEKIKGYMAELAGNRLGIEPVLNVG